MCPEFTFIAIRFQEVSFVAKYNEADDRYWVMLEAKDPHAKADLWASPTEIASALYLGIKGRAPGETWAIVEYAEAFMKRVEKQAGLQNNGYVPYTLRFIP